jgi:HSP20 family protein
MSDIVKEEREPAEVRAELTRSGESYSPRVDIVETDNELTLYADMPGVDPAGVDLKYEKSELTVHGAVVPRNEGVQYSHAEYGIGDFYRTFAIGPEIDAEKISAEISGGVLTVHLPKSEAVKPRRIEVKGS